MRYLELDVQLTRDRVPLVLHDATLKRTHGLDVDVTRSDCGELVRLGVLAGGGHPPPVPLLAQFAAWLGGEPALHAFVEIKKESLRAHGRRTVLDSVVPCLSAVRARVHLISYDARVLAMARRSGYAVGYVLPGLASRYRAAAVRLAPELLLAERHQLRRAGATWPGAWRWAAFEIGDVAAAREMIGLGVPYLESMDPGTLLAAGIGAAP